MSTGWNSQVGGGEYRIQFETDNKDFYKIVSKACEDVMDIIAMNEEIVEICKQSNKRTKKEK